MADQAAAPAPVGDPDDTFSKLLRRNASQRGARPASREKEYGIWQTWSWAEVEREVRALACGLATLGLKRGDRVAIVGDNRPRLYWTMVAAQAIGGVPVPVYQDAVADEMKYVLDHAEVRFVVAEDQEQVDKVLAVREFCPRIDAVVFCDPRGMRHYDQSFLRQYDRMQDEGRAYDAAHPGFYEAEIATGKGSDVAIMLYTSGTTGTPKGCMLSFDNLIVTARNAAEREHLTEAEEVLAYLPMAWVGDNIFSLAQAYATGFCVSCPESSATVMTDLRELGPTYFFAPPRIFENVLTQVMIRMEDASWIKRRMFHYFMNLAKRVGIAILDGKPAGIIDRLLYALGGVLVYGPLKNTLGFSRIRLAYTAGEAIGPDIFDFYRSLGMNIKQLYGMTETAVFICIQPDGQVKPDTVGTPAPEVEVKIADNGEVLVRSPGVFLRYYKNDAATAEAKTGDGWVHTGDAGYFDGDGHLKIIDRAKDVGRLTGGGLFAPKYLENKLKFFPFIKEAVAFGHGRDHAAAFINIDREATGNWAERQGLAYASYSDLAARAEVYDQIRQCIEKVNADLAADPKLAASQIRRFLILHKELDADDGELTRTRKVRRSFVAERYAKQIGALYSNADAIDIEAQVTFEDGRKGMLKAKLKIAEAHTFAPTDTVRRAG
ncbi:MAG: long-chain fatty acid--CoA ligase [Alphaproteobacteria bacterium]|nr:long-chain fatty acid--CoA ligase [Alphaproteobacteria bacterium]